MGDYIYSSANWFTLGAIDGLGAQARASLDGFIANPGVYTGLNLLTGGILGGVVDTVGMAIFPQAYDKKFFSPEHVTAYVGTIALGYGVGKGVKAGQAALTDPHSTAGLDIISQKPGNVAQSQAAMAGTQGMQKIFPSDPNDFNPGGLTQTQYQTPNGTIIKWFDKSGKAVYEWDQDIQFGSHYHIITDGKNARLPGPSGDGHFWPGDSMP